jgi:hypothetical protein
MTLIPGAMVMKLSWAQFIIVPNKLECFFLGTPFLFILVFVGEGSFQVLSSRVGFCPYLQT